MHKALDLLKYLISILVMLSAVSTAFGPTSPVGGTFDFVYTVRGVRIALGVCIFFAGALLFYGKLRKNRKVTGWGLMAVYLCFVFGTVVNFITFPKIPSYWIGNLIFALITGLLWLRWRFKTQYVDPKGFKSTVVKLRE
jgi:hypothetical protein